MTDSEKLLVLAALADGWKQSVEDWLSADEVAVRLNRWLPERAEVRGPARAQGMSTRLSQLARQGLVEKRKEWGGFHTYRCSESVRKLFA